MATRTKPGENLLEKLQPFRGDVGRERDEARGVSARAGKARDQTQRHGIGVGHEHDGYGSGQPQHGYERRAARGQNDDGFQLEQFGGLDGGAFRIANRATILDPDIAAVGPSKPIEGILEPGKMRRSFRIGIGIGGENANQAPASGLCQRAVGNAAGNDRCRRAAEKQAPLHILSSIHRFAARSIPQIGHCRLFP